LIHYCGEELDMKRMMMRDELFSSIDRLKLSRRAEHLLRKYQFYLVGDLVIMTQWEMLKFRGMGKKTFAEIREQIASLGLDFGMRLEDWPPRDGPNLEKYNGEMSKRSNI
jgi:DNA-directed RNA polymerase subunit alpha